ncbi:MAG TPA: phage tail protein [Burkholderiales bacterium]|nr:phage tail protein [Burkholderiales bacterium]
MAHYYPPPAFHFKVEVNGFATGNDVRFSDVSGLTMEMVTEELAEGGENRYVQKYPARAKFPELVLKRGLLSKSDLFDWFRQCILDLDIVPRDVDVKLLDENHDPLVTWHLVNAYPTKWALGDLGANSNAVAVETLQLYYQYFTVDASTVPPLQI